MDFNKNDQKSKEDKEILKAIPDYQVCKEKDWLPTDVAMNSSDVATQTPLLLNRFTQ